MQSGAETQEWATSLARQASFARGYSPLSAAILDCLRASLGAHEAEEGASSRLRRRFMAFVSARGWDNDREPILKLAATLHSHVLRVELGASAGRRRRSSRRPRRPGRRDRAGRVHLGRPTTQGQRYTIELGWGHPHCARLVFGPGSSDLAGLRGPE